MQIIETIALIIALNGDVTEINIGLSLEFAEFLISQPKPTETSPKKTANNICVKLNEKRKVSIGFEPTLIKFRASASISESIKYVIN